MRDLESMCRDKMLKILLQQYLPLAAVSKRINTARYSTTSSSARASSVAGTSMPSALAVFGLTTSWYVVGACTRRSAGLSPRKVAIDTAGGGARFWIVSTPQGGSVTTRCG